MENNKDNTTFNNYEQIYCYLMIVVLDVIKSYLWAQIQCSIRGATASLRRNPLGTCHCRSLHNNQHILLYSFRCNLDIHLCMFLNNRQSNCNNIPFHFGLRALGSGRAFG